MVVKRDGAVGVVAMGENDLGCFVRLAMHACCGVCGLFFMGISGRISRCMVWRCKKKKKKTVAGLWNQRTVVFIE